MESYSVYKHVNKLNQKQYIGITKQEPETRWGSNGVNYKDKCPHFWNAIQKYGWNSFEHIVVATGLTKDEACDMEKRLIKDNRTQDRLFGYNTFEGGSAPSIPDEVRAKMSASSIGNKKCLGRPCSDETRKKISDAQKGRKLTDEHRKKLSDAKKGKRRPPPSEDTRRKISDSHVKKPVYCTETDTIYPSVQECARQLNIWATLVTKCCKGKLKTTGGYHLEYINN